NSRRVPFLHSIPEAIPSPVPVAVIVAVRNEERDLAEALRSLLRLTYPAYRLVVVNDRSTDRTPQILEQFAETHPHLNLITVDHLPEGWLGKNHALYQGYRSTQEDWMLFTDADVVFAPETLDRAMTYVHRQQLDHLTVLPQITSRSQALRSVLATFQVMLEFRHRPWDTLNPRSSASLGVGAFNLVRRSAYEQAGTHQAFSLRPDDDLKLGHQIKKSGGRQGVLYGHRQIWLEWYTSVGEFVQGLMKNTFAVYRYRFLPLFLLGVVPTLLFFVLPLPLLLWCGSSGGWLPAGLLLAAQGVLLFGKRGSEARWWYPLAIPFAGLLMAFIMLRAAWVTLKQGGIYWRDQFYALKELRKQA
ncbi:MAG TPA: glycosyltransferase family 2 protein, partial [Chitinophagaceae bacterium]|nr:glycosyltransferase family 2 protein [Chitinophagaceae bacterium]